MNLLVFGASGATGKMVIAQARAAGHLVTAFVRNPASLAMEGLRVIVGDGTDSAAVAAAIPGHDAVICALGVRNTSRYCYAISSATRRPASASSVQADSTGRSSIRPC